MCSVGIEPGNSQDLSNVHMDSTNKVGYHNLNLKSGLEWIEDEDPTKISRFNDNRDSMTGM